MRRAMGLQRNYFKFETFRVMNHKYRMDKSPLTEATIRLTVGGDEVHTASLGEGPVNALDKAIVITSYSIHYTKLYDIRL